MATATLELVNPYAKYGLKRRPTYDEIANLKSENEQLTGAFTKQRRYIFQEDTTGKFLRRNRPSRTAEGRAEQDNGKTDEGNHLTTKCQTERNNF